MEVKSAVGITIEGSYIDSCFVPEMLSRFKTARRKVLNALELAQKKGINITALGGFTSIIFENFNLLQHKQIRIHLLNGKDLQLGIHIRHGLSVVSLNRMHQKLELILKMLKSLLLERLVI